MKRTLKRCFIGIMLAVLLGTSCLLAACGDNETPPGTETTFTIEGVVSSDFGPLSGVAVTLGEERKTTGTAGSYSFEVAEGEYTLTFAKDGYVTQTKTVNTDNAVSGKVTLNVSMAAAQKEYVVISGKVTDAKSGAALEGAVISGSALESSVTTDTDGAYTLPQLEKGSYSFTVSMNGYTSQTVSVSESDITGTAYTLNIQLTAIPAEELVTVSGTVTADYPEGALAGVTVKIGTTEVKTDANGAYSVQTSRDACTVEFSKAGYAAVSESVSAEDVADGAHTLNAEMTRNTVLAGKTNAELVEEYSSMNNIAVSGQLKDLIHAGTYWKEGGADGSAAGILSEGYRLESKQDNANDEFRRYIYGKMTVSAENKIFDFWGRTFGTTTEFAVSVIDPVTLDRTLVKATGAEVVWASLLSETLVRFTYDLSAFEGQNVILALGVRKAALTVERVSFGPGTYVFGRTTKAEFDGAKTLDLTTKTSYEGGEIRTAWNVLGNIEGKNTDSDYATKNARFYACYVGQNTAADADLFMYVYAKVNITGANARMSIRWYNDRAPFLRVTAFDATTGAVVQTVNAEKGSGDTETSTVDLADCIGKTVVLAIGMTSGERLELQKISFARYSYTLKGTVTLPQDGEYELSKVSFKLNDNTLTNGEGGFAFDTATGAYTLNLKVDDTGTLTVSYDNSDITIDTQKLLNATYTLSGTATQDEVTQDFTLQQDSNVPQAISITLNAGTVALAKTDVEIKLGTNEFTYENGKWSLNELTMAEAVALGNVTITLKGKYANIYADPSFTLTTSDYSGGSANKEITLKEKDILPGLTFSQLQATEIKEVPAISSSGKTAIGNLWNAGGAADSGCDVIGEGYRMTSGSDNANDEYRRYIYGKLDVTENNDTLTLYGRTFGTETEFAVKVIDFTTFEGTFIQATGSNTIWQKYNGSDYGKYMYDLSDFDGKTVIVAIGVRKAALTLESILLSADGTFAFGRTSAAALQGLQAVNIATGTKFSAGSDPKIQETFVTVGAAKVDNNRWMLVDARGGNTDDAQPHSYVYCKTNITSANARMSIRWSSYNNGDRALTKVLAVNAQDNSVIHLYSGNNSVNGEWCEARFDLTECVGKEVILAIGMSYGNRMGIDYIRFDRMSYTLTGTVSLPEGDYSLDKVSFTLDGSPLTSGENGFTFDTQTGEYSLKLDASVTEGTLKVSYDNAGIADPTQQLVEAAFSLSDIDDYGNAAWSPTLSKNSNVAQTIYVTISIDSTEALLTDDQAEEVTVKLGNDHTFSYAGEGVWKLEGLTMAEAMAAGDLTVTFAEEGTLANIYEAVNEGTLSGSDYANGQADISVSLVERDILPGLTLSEMKSATVLSYDYYQGLWAHNVFRNFAKSEGIRSEEQEEGDTIQTETTRATSETEFNGYIYARKTITDENKTMIISMRTHNTSIATRFGVMVVDLTTGARKLVGGMLSSTANSYTDQVFDLSAYVGKEVLVSTGIFYTQACDGALPDGQQLQYVIESIRFVSAAADWKTDSAENWDATVDTIAGNLLANESVAAKSMTYFQGANNDSGNKNYIFKTWGAVSKGQDYAGIEPVGEGAMIKTRNGSSDTSDNRAFLYAKFTITEETSYLWLNARRFSGSNHVGSALTVYTADGGRVVAPDSTNFVMPSGGAYEVESDNWIKWHDGDSGYAYLKWDLSSYIGQTVVLVIGVRNTYNSEEGKMAIQEIHLGSAADGQSAGKVTA